MSADDITVTIPRALIEAVREAPYWPAGARDVRKVALADAVLAQVAAQSPVVPRSPAGGGSVTAAEAPQGGFTTTGERGGGTMQYRCGQCGESVDAVPPIDPQCVKCGGRLVAQCGPL